jgi:hypothetical protein
MIILAILGVVFAFVFALLAVFFDDKDWIICTGISAAVSILCVSAVIVTGVWGACLYSDSIKDYSKMMAAKNVIPVYQKMVSDTNSDAIVKLSAKDADGIADGLGNFKQSTNVSERMKEYRDYLQSYEVLRQKYILYNSNWLFRTCLLKQPKGLFDLEAK